ncbi:porin family protein [Pararhodonellum marinum]|uniref:porin family protein n=1 Tax=Pararhodonellum marinum TaxID=2755358 RepID=UPI00188FEF01|nr:porin family protein [Pararhodonellum marinum]
MKKLILLFSLITILGVGTTYGQFLRVGLKAGPNFSNFSGGSIEGYDFSQISSFHAGLLVEFKLLQNLSLQPELLYSTKGANLSGIGNEFKNKLGYLSIPALARFYLVEEKFSLDLGPQFSFLLDETEHVDISNSNSFDFAVVGGATFHLTDTFFLQGRYNLGLTDVKPDADVKNSVIQLSLGVRF